MAKAIAAKHRAVQLVVKVPEAEAGVDGKNVFALDVVGYRVVLAVRRRRRGREPASGLLEADKKQCIRERRPQIAPSVERSAAMINEAMKPVVEAANECFDEFGVAGRAKLKITVAADGTMRATSSRATSRGTADRQVHRRRDRARSRFRVDRSRNDHVERIRIPPAVTIAELLDALWRDYVATTPQAERIHRLLAERGEQVQQRSRRAAHVRRCRGSASTRSRAPFEALGWARARSLSVRRQEAASRATGSTPIRRCRRCSSASCASPSCRAAAHQIIEGLVAQLPRGLRRSAPICRTRAGRGRCARAEYESLLDRERVRGVGRRVRLPRQSLHGRRSTR